MTETIATLLGGLFLVMAAGASLRAFSKMGQREADTLNAIIMDVTLPALVVSVLSKGGLSFHAGAALTVSVTALVAAGALAYAITRALGATKPTQAAALLSAAFCNTGFLGLPLMLALFPNDTAASSTAILVDTTDTTICLWTIGIIAARAIVGAPDAAAAQTSIASTLIATLRMFARPLGVAFAAGLVLGLAHIALPDFLAHTLDMVGRCTSPLVFLALGMQLDVRSIAARAGLVVLLVVVKLVAEPIVALGLVRVLGVDATAASVVVLQAAMPSALASVIVAARVGADRSLSAGIAALSTIACLATLPAVAWLIDALK